MKAHQVQTQVASWPLLHSSRNKSALTQTMCPNCLPTNGLCVCGVDAALLKTA